MPERPALEISGLTFDYGNRRALDDVSFSIEPGEAAILLGPNGAGKTTLFSLISGLFAAQHGRIVLDGRDLVTTGAQALAPLGIVFQAQTLDLDLTVRQNLRYFCALRGIARVEADRRIAAELERFAMADRLDDKVRALNGGHRRRVEIARALLHRPRILLLDEPTVGLDIPTRRDLIAHLHARSREDGIALLWATHLIDEVEAGDRVIVLHRGQVRADGAPQDLVAQTGAGDLAQAFDRLTGAEAAA
ncbi:MAG: ATP-binding cassette domain-containing protein [Notoacmeibacter sp.]|nr:ATP-binding cassette domain-containing protein [Notoacmeibacter sp.]MCC0031940.1 ATP-binding cassette domain-containing protein [Brucellaceae bacterium]